MFSFYICKLIDENLYDEKIEIDKLDYFIKKYSLIDHGEIKEYWINNVEVLKNSKGYISFNYITDKSVIYNKNINVIIREYEKQKCNEFQFYKSDCEIVYKLYKSDLNENIILLKDFNTYFTIEIVSENEKTIFNHINFDEIKSFF